jgi:uncharacterized protein YyaL (SSP411 family)
LSALVPSRRGFLIAGASAIGLLRSRAADTSSKSADGDLNPTYLRNAIRLGCAWLTDVAQIKTDKLNGTETNTRQLMHKHWKGALRGDYRTADRKWDFSSPIPHTGQALKALVMASRVIEDEQYLAGARFSAEFIGAERNTDRRSKNSGLIYAYRYKSDDVDTGALLRTIDGLFALAEATADRKYSDWGLDAAFWAARNAYVSDGLFRDAFDVKTGQFAAPPWPNEKPGRPLLDDGIMLKAYKQTRNALCKKIFFATADRLLKEEEAPGNWSHYPPGSRSPYSDPRQSYWWGAPMIAAFQESGDKRYLDCARRVGDWYLHMTRDEADPFHGSLRASAGIDTSGMACAAILWLDLFQETKDERWISAARRALRYCLNMQFREVQDPNLKGAFLEQVLPPNGSDRSPFYVRDIATIFFVQAACKYLS